MTVLGLVSNMKEMRDELETHALKIEKEESEEDDSGNNKKIKTYLIESNIPCPVTDEIFKVTDTKDSNLKMLMSRDANKFLFYVDTSNERFWQIHTAEPAFPADKMIREYVLKNNSKLDFSWFYSNFLEAECNIGKAKGFKIKFQDLFSELIDEDGKEPNIEKFSMLFLGGKASEVIQALRKTDLSNGVSLSAILTKYYIEKNYSKENIQYNGKFTLTKTTSIDSHLNAVNKISKKYASHIEKIEDKNKVSMRIDNNKVKIEGDFASITLKKEIINPELFLKTVFSGARPFRLFGLSQKIEENYYKVFGIDLHTTSKFDMEILPNELRVYLDEAGCGNVIPRLITNLQSTFSSELKYNLEG